MDVKDSSVGREGSLVLLVCAIANARAYLFFLMKQDGIRNVEP